MDIERQEKYFNPERRGRKKRGEFRRGFTVAEMSQKHHEIARLLVMGNSGRRIGEYLGVSDSMISNVKNSPVVQEQMSFLSAKKDVAVVKVQEQIALALPKCVAYLSGTIEDPDIHAALRSKNAFGLLAAGGHGATKNVNVKGVHAVLSADDIKEIREQAEQIGIASGIIVDDEDDDE